MLAAGMSFVRDGSSPECAEPVSDTVSCDVGSVANGETKHVTIRVTSVAAGVKQVQATVDGIEGDEIEANDSMTASTTILERPDPVPPTPPTPPTPPVTKPDITLQVRVPLARYVVVPAAALRFRALARFGVLPVTIPMPEKGTTAKVRLTISAAQARALKLKVPQKAKVVVIGTVATKKSTVAGQKVKTNIKLTKAAQKAFRRRSNLRLVRAALTLTFSKPDRKPKTITKPLRFKR